MSLLMVSLDKKIVEGKNRVEQPRVVRRMHKYSKEHSELHIIVFTKEGFFNDKPYSEKLWVHPTNSVSKINYVLDAYRIGKKILKSKNEARIKSFEITTQDPFFTGLVGLGLKRKFNISLEVQLHGDFYGSKFYSTGLFGIAQLLLGKFIIKRADKIRVVSERVKYNLINKLRVLENKIEVQPIKYGFQHLVKEKQKFDIHKRYPNFSKIFLYVGRFDPVKNLPWLIETFHKFLQIRPDSCLVIVGGTGETKEEKELRNLVQKMHIEENVKFDNFAHEVISYYKSVDCLLVPSLSEGYGLVAMEAFYSGCKVIMTDVGVANYELKPGEQVQVTAINDREAFINAMSKI